MNRIDQHRPSLGNVDLAERRLLFDTSWPLLLLIMTAAYMLSWSMGLLAIDLSTVLWATFGLGLAHHLLSRLLDLVQAGSGLIVLHTILNFIAVSALGVVWSLLGGLAAPAFAIFLALPIIALGLVTRFVLQFALTVYAILVAWLVALQGSEALRLHFEQMGAPAVWSILPGTAERSFAGYGMVSGGSEQFQFMLVFSFAMFGVVTTSSIVVTLIGRLYQRLKFISASEDRAEHLAQSFLTQEDGLEFILDRDSFQIIAVSPRLADVLESPPETLVGCHYSVILPFEPGHPAQRLIEMGFPAELPNQVIPTVDTYKLVNFRLHPAISSGREYQRISLDELHENDYARITLNSLQDICGVVDGGGRILYLSAAARDVLPVIRDQWQADALPLPAGWWEIAPRTSHRRQIVIADSEYQINLRRLEFQLRHCRGARNPHSDEMELTVFRLVQSGSQRE